MSEDPRSLAVNHSNFTSNGSPSQIKSIVGDVRSSILTEAQFLSQVGQGWVLADGQDVTGSPYETLTGSATVPDMRGVFLRGKNNGRSDGNENPDGEVTIGDVSLDKTRSPRDSGFTADSNGAHSHTTTAYRGSGNPYAGLSGGDTDESNYSYSTSTAGNHTHAVSGGDNETRPINVTVNYFIYVGF